MAATELISARFAETAHLMGAVRKLLLIGGEPGQDLRCRMMNDRARVQAELAELIEPDAARLRRSSDSAARLLLLFCDAHTYGPFSDPGGFDAEEIVSLLLDGLLIRQDNHRGAQSTC